MNKPNALMWRESAALAHMHMTLATSKFQSVTYRDNHDLERVMREMEKAIECIESAHAHAMKAYDEYALLTRYRQNLKGVRLTSIAKINPPLTAPISEFKK